MSAQKIVSIVVPVHNKAKAKICVEHIKQQTYQNIELILVDFKGFPAEKRNYGYRKSRGVYVLFLDEDEYMTPTTVSVCVNKFDEVFDMVGIPQIKLEPKNYMGRCVSILRENIFKPLFFKREVIEHVGLFCHEYVLCDDLDMIIRALLGGYRLGVIDVKDGYIIHDEDNSLTGILRKTFLTRKSYKKLQNNYGQKLDILTRKHSQRRRIFRILIKQPILIPGTLLVMLIRFVIRRIP